MRKLHLKTISATKTDFFGGGIKMSLEKAIRSGKEKRKPYTGAKAVDATCRNHGGDDWELNNRLHKYRRRSIDSVQQRDACGYAVPFRKAGRF